MKKAILLIAISLMAVAMLFFPIGSVFAESVQTDYETVGGTCIIDVAGHTRIRFVAYGNQQGDYYCGSSDRIMLWVDTGNVNPTTGLPVFKSVAGYEDNTMRSAFSASLDMGVKENLVKPWQIGVIQMGKTAIVYWTLPLVCPATGAPNPTSEVVLPPGILVLAGSGELIHVPAAAPAKLGNAGWYYTTDLHYYGADATLVCPGWHYCGPVGATFAGTTLGARAVTDRIWVWTHA